MLSYRATLDLPTTIVRRISAWLSAHRRRHDRRPWQPAATCWTQAILLCRWMCDATPIHRLARDHGLSQATCYRYLHEALDVVADHAPDLHEVLDEQHAHGAAFVCLDGTLIATTAVHTPAERANAILKHFKALQKVTLDPWRITAIVRSALVIATHMRGAW
jgi:hypothetical protein